MEREQSWLGGNSVLPEENFAHTGQDRDELSGRGRAVPSGTSWRGLHDGDFPVGTLITAGTPPRGRVVRARTNYPQPKSGGQLNVFELGHGDSSFLWSGGNQLMHLALNLMSGNVFKSIEAIRGPTTF